MKVLLFIVAMLLMVGTASAGTYYLSENGTSSKASATGPCTTAANCMNVTTHNAATFSTGDTIIVCDNGGIFRQRLNPPSSGDNANNLITYRTIAGSNPIISGAELTITWSDEGSNIWSASVTTGEGDPTQVFFNGTKGTEESVQAHVNSTNDWWFNATTNTLYIFSVSDPDTAYVNPGIESSTRACLAQNDRSFVHFENITLEKSYSTTISTHETHASRLENITIQDAGNTGLKIYGEAGYIKNSTFTRIKNSAIDGENCSNYTVSDCDISHVFGNDAVTLHDGTGVGNIIENNTMSHLGEEGVDILNGFTGTITRDNEISYCSENGIKYQSGVPGIITRNNVSHVLMNGITVGGNVTVSYNLVDNSTNTNGGFSAMYFRADADNASAYNNVFTHSTSSTGFVVTIKNGATGINLVNNILYIPNIVERYVIIETDADITGEIHHNDYYGCSPANAWKNETAYMTFSEWQTYTGHSTDINTDPVFTNFTAKDYSLQSTSPCINTGVDVGLTTDYLGNSIVGIPDIGAYEYQPAVNTSTITIPANSQGMYNNWTSATTFSAIATNESNDDVYSFYNVSGGLYESYYPGYSWNANNPIGRDNSVIVFVNAETTVTADIVTPSSTELLEGWNMLYVQGSDNETIADIKTDIGVNCSAVYWFNSSAGAYSDTSTDIVQPNQGFLAYIDTAFTWTRSDL